MFCREALAEVSAQRKSIEANGHGIVLIHLDADDTRAQAMFACYGLDDVLRVSDPAGELYHDFGLMRGGLRALARPRVFARGIDACIRGGHSIGRPTGDVRQMPGAFLVHHGRIHRSFRARHIAERPNWTTLTAPLHDTSGSV